MDGPRNELALMLTRERRCGVCLEPVPEGAGVRHADLDVLAHQQPCSALIAATWAPAPSGATEIAAT